MVLYRGYIGIMEKKWKLLSYSSFFLRVLCSDVRFRVSKLDSS